VPYLVSRTTENFCLHPDLYLGDHYGKPTYHRLKTALNPEIAGHLRGLRKTLAEKLSEQQCTYSLRQ